VFCISSVTPNTCRIPPSDICLLACCLWYHNLPHSPMTALLDSGANSGETLTIGPVNTFVHNACE